MPKSPFRPIVHNRVGVFVRTVLGVIGTLLCLGSECMDDAGKLPQMDVTVTPTNDGASLEITWAPHPNYDSVEIEYEVDTARLRFSVDAAAQSATLDSPTWRFSVQGHAGDSSTDVGFYDMRAVVTSVITLYPASDTLTPGHEAHGLYFDTFDGTAFGMPYSNNLGRMGSMFVLVNSGDTLFLQSAKDVIFRGSGWSPSSSGKGIAVGENFADLKPCPGPGAGRVSKLRIQEGETYALEVVRSDTSRFVKLKVEEIAGNAATLKVAVQKKAWLRWVVIAG